MPKPLLPEDVWELIHPLLPERAPHPKGGRPAVADRDVLTGILFVLRSGVPWAELPEEMGCGSGMTCLRRLREWQRADVWDKVETILRERLQNTERLPWSRLAPCYPSIIKESSTADLPAVAAGLGDPVHEQV